MESGQGELVAVGDNCIDVYLPPIGRSAVGGNAVNVAVHWARGGHASGYLGVVGDDDAGARVRRTVAEMIGRTHVDVLPGLTGVTEIALGEDGERTLVSEDFGVGGDYRPDAELLRDRCGGDWVHCTLPVGPAPVRDALAGATALSYDFSTRHDALDVDGLEVAFLSWAGRPDDPAAADMAADVVARGAATAVLTCGAHGSLAFAGGELVVAAAVPVAPVDTLGAGDAFIAGFISARLHGGALDAALRSGARLASAVCGHLAGFEQRLEPLTEEVEQ